MNLNRLWLPLGVILIVIFYAPELLSQCYIQYGWRWQSNTVTYQINSSLATPWATQTGYETAIDAAANQWNNAGSNFQFTIGDNVNYDYGNVPDGIFQVGWYIADFDTAHAVSVVDHPNGTITKVETYYNLYYVFASTSSNKRRYSHDTIPKAQRHS
jgi:hypothetical protein